MRSGDAMKEEPMEIVSVNVGGAREVEWKGQLVRTGIFKVPVRGHVRVGRLGLEGDTQVDLRVHGGLEKAVYAYPVEHYERWRAEMPEVEFSPGMFGENLTVRGIDEDELEVGQRFRAGTALLEVTQPRQPCYKLNLRFGRDDMIRRMLESGRHGFYFSVVEEGEVWAGAEILDEQTLS